MVRLLVSGFEPSWGIKITPSGELAKLWGKEKLLEDVEVKSVILPQLYGVCSQIMYNSIAEFNPEVILMYGATPKNTPIKVERFAINAEHTPAGDNSRIPVRDRPVIRGGPSAYESTIPVIELVDHLNASGIEARASYHAGEHVCNSVLYSVLHYLNMHPEMKTIAGFIHTSFPNEFGVHADEHWSTASWASIRQASVMLTQEVVRWYDKNMKKPDV